MKTPVPETPQTETAKWTLPSVICGFEIIRKLGNGAMGVVVLARQVSLDREVALKILPPKNGPRAEIVQ